MTVKSVFWDLEDTPAAAEIMTARSDLMWALTNIIKSRRWSRARAAKELGVTPARLAELLDGRIGRFTVEDLIGMGAAVGMTVRAVGTGNWPQIAQDSQLPLPAG